LTGAGADRARLLGVELSLGGSLYNDTAVGDKRGNRTDSRQPGRKHGTDYSDSQWELSYRVVTLLDRDATHVSFRYQPLDLGQQSVSLDPELFGLHWSLLLAHCVVFALTLNVADPTRLPRG
jgi:hypothetical protein